MKEEKIILITAGRGPIECSWIVAKVQKILISEALASDINITILNRVEGTENATLQSVRIMLEGKNVTKFLTNWLGTIKWIENSMFRKNHARKNWFIGVFEESNPTSVVINEKDIEYQAIRSSGAGGQHVNKVSSAVRAKHIPTGIQVLVQDSRSQHQNKKIAYQRLCEKYRTHQLEILETKQQQNWENHLNLKRGNAIRVFNSSDIKPKHEQLNYKKTRIQLKQELLKIE